jgi:FHS family glucose/mannose:H+ symporter-like MFS transporter
LIQRGATDRIFLSKRLLIALAAIYLLLGTLAAAYGPMLEHLTVRFGISLSSSGAVLSAHYGGAFVGVMLSIWKLQRLRVGLSAIVSLSCLGVGCVAVVLASSWTLFLIAVFVVGLGFGALSIGLNQLVAYSALKKRSAALNLLSGASSVGAVIAPILVASLGGWRFTALYAGSAVLAVGLIPAVARISGRLPIAPTSAQGPGMHMGVFVVAFMFYIAVEAGIGGWMTSHLESVGQRSVVAETLTSGYWLAVALGRFLMILMPPRVPVSDVVITCSTLSVLLLPVTLIGQAAPVAYIAVGLVIAPIFPTGIAWLARLRPRDSRAMSWVFPASMLGGAIVPGGIGLVIDKFGIAWTPVVLSGLAIGTLAAFVLASSARLRQRSNGS